MAAAWVGGGTLAAARYLPVEARRGSPGDEHGGVVVSDPVVRYGVTVAVPMLDGLLPLTEAV